MLDSTSTLAPASDFEHRIEDAYNALLASDNLSIGHNLTGLLQLIPGFQLNSESREAIEKDTTITNPEKWFMSPVCSARVFDLSGESLDVVIVLTPLNKLLTVNHRVGDLSIVLPTSIVGGVLNITKINVQDANGDLTAALRIGGPGHQKYEISEIVGDFRSQDFINKLVNPIKLLVGLTSPGLSVRPDPFEYVINEALSD